MDARDVIARRITGRRKELGLTQQEVAERGKLALRSYQRYERGSVMPRKLARERLVAALELAIGELEPPTEDQTKEEEATTRDQLREVLARLAHIEDLLTERELEELEAEAEAKLRARSAAPDRRAAEDA